MNPRLARIVVREAIRRLVPAKEEFQARRAWRFVSALHKFQQAVRRSPGKRKAVLCSRRAGKSFLAASMLLEAAGDHPNSLAVYLTLTREQARRIMWRELKRFNRLYALGLEFNETKLICTLRNGSEIILLGAMNERDIDRIRGVPFVLAVIDEAASFPVRRSAYRQAAMNKSGEDDRALAEGDLLYKIYRDVLQPTMLDYQGTVLMIGTPAAHCSGFFFQTTHPDPKQRRKGWEFHHWTVLDNPHVPRIKTVEIPDAAAWLRQMREEENILLTDASYKREWLGEWVRSVEALVYFSYDPARNLYTSIPKDERLEWFYGASVDLGYDDPTVMGLFKWSTDDPNTYLTKVIKKAKMIPARIAGELKRWQKETDGLSFIVVDQGGGAGKMIAEEFTQRWQLPNVKGAEKQKKPTFIELMNGDLATGRLKIHESCGPVLDEIGILQWDPKFPGRKEDERFPNDAMDMTLYGWRECRHYRFDEDKLPDEIAPTEEEKDEDEMEEKAERGLKKLESEDWYSP